MFLFSFQAPYVLTVRAIDNGEESQLFTDTEVYITVGDVSSNDGVPDFERPKVDEIAYVAEVSLLLGGARDWFGDLIYVHRAN